MVVDLDVVDEEDNQISVKLWDGYAKDIIDYIGRNSDIKKRFVVVIQYAKIKSSNSISNTWGITRLSIEPDIEEVRSFKQRRHQLFGDTSTDLQTCTQSSTMSAQLNFNDYGRVWLYELPSVTKGYYATLATIYGFDTEDDWWYNSCHKCRKTITVTASGTFQCPNCPNPIALPRFKLKCKVSDDLDTSMFILWDHVVTQETGLSAKYLRDSQVKAGTLRDYPEELNVPFDKEYVFILNIDDYIVKQPPSIFKCYTVYKMRCDVEVLRNFHQHYGKKKLDSVGIGSQECLSKAADSEMDTIVSLTGDSSSLTPSKRDVFHVETEDALEKSSAKKVERLRSK